MRAALELAGTGATATDVSKRLGVLRRTVSDWLSGAVRHSTDADADRGHDASELSPDYVYLLGRIEADVAILDELIEPKR